ncbi:MAG TPA: hypothetical protein VJX74_02070 [Blastocatellia bacterium]|nr:hypothetical protein [Blastocatellia bacterium]
MAEKIAREKRRDFRQGQTGKFGMLHMMAFGLTAAEARAEIADGYSRNNYGLRDVILNSQHFDLEQANTRFEAFLNSDLKAARLFDLLQAHRIEGRDWCEIIRETGSEQDSLAAALYLRMHEYCRKVWGHEFEEYETYSKEAEEWLKRLDEQKYQFKADEA